jgi:hypothetical protein
MKTITRTKIIKELLNQFTLCENTVFDCRDKSLQKGDFEKLSNIDMKASTDQQQKQIKTLLNARSKINLRLKIAERALQKLKERVSE